jgi:hypothetical protein
MSSPFQKKFMAKNPTKGFTMAELERLTAKAEKQMKENAAILPQIEGPGNPDFESKDPQRFAGDDTHTYGKKDDSPLNAYVSTAGHFQRMQDNIARAFTPTKGAKTKAEKETEFKGETEKISENLEEINNKEFKGFKDGEYQVPSLSDMQKIIDGENHFNRFGQ